MRYRSDWPEIGLSSAINEEPPARAATPPDWVHESRAGDLLLRWVASKDGFESRLYNFPIWNLHLELEHAGRDIPDSGMLRTVITAEIERFAAAPPWGISYVFSRVVESEPLSRPLLECGFQEVERRRLYRTRVADIRVIDCEGRSIRFVPLADIPPEQRRSCREQIFEICGEAFRDKGYSRHFADPFLSGRMPGRAYISAAMELNFERLPVESFLLSLASDAGCVCGFSVVGKKTGLTSSMYTQLLSAVRREYQGRDIYLGLTRLLVQKLPQDAVLLNATHAGNVAMQQAYQRSGRLHLADTVVLRRVFE